MLRFLRSVAAGVACVLVCVVAALAAQEPPVVKPAAKGIEGIWEGPLKVGAIELRLAFKIKKDADGKLAATMDSIDQGAKDIPIAEVSFEGGKLTFAALKLKAKFVGTLAEDGQSIKGEFEQAGLKLPLELMRVERVSTLNRPQMPKKPFPYPAEDVTFENKPAGAKLAGTLTLPKGDGPFPAVVLISGSGPQDRDETLFGHKPFLVIADHFARNGIAVLRFDDRGVGKSGGKHEGATSADFATDVHAAVKFLQGRKEIDSKRIGLMGHSEGGLIAPMVAADHPDDVGFIVLLAGPGLPGNEVLRSQQKVILKAMGMGTEKIEMMQRLQKAAVTAVMKAAPDKMKAEAKDAVKTFLDSLTEAERKSIGLGKSGDEVTDAIVGRVADPWMAYFFKYDPRPTLGKVRCPVLAVNGELDLQVVTDENLSAIEKAVKAGGNDSVTVKEFPKLNHLFQKAKTGLPNEYGQLEETFDPEALKYLTEWVLNQK
ncbi:MAG TPA: alpha/beta fold hydrolase [Fimbriiglobus sp.]|jgi:pimeloyl-ACP methyl ester carboxylesterase|nr:alpha/beta fold hydrolase [Fimbriiglobus sp.]